MTQPRLIYQLVVDGLELPSANEVIRWHWTKQRKETRRVAKWIWATAVACGMTRCEPLAKAVVKIVVEGPYKTDGDNIWIKDTLDAIKGGGDCALIEDDAPKCIGKPEVALVASDVYRVVIEVYDAPLSSEERKTGRR